MDVEMVAEIKISTSASNVTLTSLWPRLLGGVLFSTNIYSVDHHNFKPLTRVPGGGKGA